MPTIYLECDATVEVTRLPDDGDSWDRGDTRTDWSFGNFYLNQSKNRNCTSFYESYTIDDAVKVGDTVHAVVAIWSDGDSFGHDHRRRAEIFHASVNPETAANALDMLRDEKKPDGTLYWKYELPWHGYFESLDDMFIHSAVVSAPKL